MKKYLLALSSLALFASASAHATQALPVFSANGFICGKEGITVTCKGNMPSGVGSVTGTGHDMVYLTVNIQQEGRPARYTYFSDTGCLIGYTFTATGEPSEGVASHRGGAKKTFDLKGGQFERLVDYCTSEQGTVQAAKETAPAAPAAEAPPAMKPAAGSPGAVTAKQTTAPKNP